MIKFRTIIFVFAINIGLFCIVPYVGAATINSSAVNRGSTLTTGLVDYWTMDSPDIAGTQVYDKAGTAVGTMTGGVTKTTGKIGQALKFNGSTGYVNYADNASFNFGANNFTVSFWVRLSSLPGNNTAKMFFGQAGGDDAPISNFSSYFYLYNLSGTQQVKYAYTTNGTDYTGKVSAWNYTFTTGVWHFVTLQRSGATLTATVDNSTIIGTANLGTDAIFDSTTNFKIGASLDVTNYFLNGTLDDFRIYNRALSAQEMKQLYAMGGDKIQASTVNKGGTLASSGLVGHWTFDGADIAGTQVYDKSGNNNTGTMNGGIKKITGKLGQALKFDGSTGYMDVGNNLFSSNTSGTISAWVNSSGFSNIQNIFSSSFSSGKDLLLVGIISTGKIYVQFYNNTFNNAYQGDTTVLQAGHWYNIVVESNGSIWSIYVNGVKQSLSSLAGSNGGQWFSSLSLDSHNVRAGRMSYSIGSYYLNGSIDDVRIYNRALSAQEVRQLYAMGGDKIQASTVNRGGALASSGLVGHWTFDSPDIAGTQAYDKSGNNNTGTLTGGVTKTTGKIGQAIKTNGTNGYVDVPDSASLKFGTGDFTVSAWIKPGVVVYGPTNAGEIVSKDLHNYEIMVYQGYLVGYVHDSQIVANVVVKVGVWQHVILTRKGNTIYIYFNGIMASSIVNSGDTSATTADLNMGYRPGASNSWYSGSIDDVRIYNRALSAQEIKQLYAMGK